MGRSSSDVGPDDPSARRRAGRAWNVTKEVSHMMPMMSWMSVMAWFTLLGVLLLVAGVGAIVAYLVSQHDRPAR